MDRNAEITKMAELYESGVPAYKIAALMHCSPPTVLNALETLM